VIRPGAAYGTPASGPPELDVQGDDAALAAAVADRPGALVRFEPNGRSDLARAVGLARPPADNGATEVTIDGLRTDESFAVNAVVLGTPPDQARVWARTFPVAVTVDGRDTFDGCAWCVLVASGQYLRGLDVVPRGHPGDGQAEVQVYALAAGERGGLRRRLPQGTHVPHPRIRQTKGHRVEITVGGRARRLEIDGHRHPPRRHLRVEVIPGAARLLV